MRISAIVAIDKKCGMGKDGGIPWHIPGEQKRFKEITMGHPIIMGRKTFDSIGRVLPGRLNVIISRNAEHTLSSQVTDCIFVTSLDQALRLAKENDPKEIFIIGGGQILKEAMPLLNRLYLTVIDKDFGCDTFFPDYSEFTKIIEKEKKHDWEYPYTYMTLERNL